MRQPLTATDSMLVPRVTRWQISYIAGFNYSYLAFRVSASFSLAVAPRTEPVFYHTPQLVEKAKHYQTIKWFSSIRSLAEVRVLKAWVTHSERHCLRSSLMRFREGRSRKLHPYQEQNRCASPGVPSGLLLGSPSSPAISVLISVIILREDASENQKDPCTLIMPESFLPALACPAADLWLRQRKTAADLVKLQCWRRTFPSKIWATVS